MSAVSDDCSNFERYYISGFHPSDVVIMMVAVNRLVNRLVDFDCKTDYWGRKFNIIGTAS